MNPETMHYVLNFNLKFVRYRHDMESFNTWNLVISYILQLLNLVKTDRLSTFSTPGIFLGLIWGRISAPSAIQKEAKLSKMVYIIPNF